MIKVFNPEYNKLIFQDDMELGRILELEYRDNHLIWTLKTKSPLKMFLITEENKYLYNKFNKLISDVKRARLYKDEETEALKYVIANDEKYVNSQFRSKLLNMLQVPGDEEEPKDNILFIYKDQKTNSIAINFSSTVRISESDNFLIPFFKEEISQKDVIYLSMKMGDSVLGDFCMPYLRLFESLVNSRSLKLAKKRTLC